MEVQPEAEILAEEFQSVIILEGRTGLHRRTLRKAITRFDLARAPYLAIGHFDGHHNNFINLSSVLAGLQI